jgi:uncharacterized membrane protein (DUF106 family)
MTLIGLSAGIEELLISSIVIFVLVMVYKLFVNQNELKELKEKLKECQSRSNELQKTNPEEAKRAMADMLNLSNKQLRMNMKPMLVSLLISVVVVFPILPNLFPGSVVMLPFSLPYFGNDFGWLVWYMIVSLPLNSIFRKFLGVEV